ncbi:hypothetical protein BJF78_33480 [Pseudonocardia sp. CNS-139]|nr:hypothetical protein BJF78_33480 [Pseudonocardia sp. CNS-139]
MNTKGAAFLRARRPEHKRQRYDAILAAARELATAESVNEVSLADIAERVGVHKSALLRYFETREEIFLRLAEAEWRDWADALVAALPEVAGEPERVADVLGASFADRPLFCQLLLHTPLTLERNVSIDVVRPFKLALAKAMEDVAAALQAALPALGPSGAVELAAVTGMVAAGAWQVANPPPVIVVLQEELAECQALTLPDLPDVVTRFARVYVAGLSGLSDTCR